MKTGSSISRPIFFLGTAAVVLSLLLLWFGLRRDNPVPVGNESEVVADAPTSADETPAAASATPTLPLMPLDGDLPPVIPISLASIITQAENDQWDKSAVFRAMPRGTQSFGGIEFWVEGAIQLQSKSSLDEKRAYREKIVVPLARTNLVGERVEIVQRGSNVGSVYLLGATRYAGEGECTVASLVWRYLDGTTRRTPIQFENHVRDWIRLPYETPAYLPYAFSKVAWYTNQSARTVRLYRFAYANPEPAKAVRQLEFTSAKAVPNLFLVGLTLDPLKLGERPDDSPNLEPLDSAPASQLEVFVQSSEGQPVQNASVRVVIQQAAGKTPTRVDRTVKADANGYARISYPPLTDVERLDIGASHDDYGAKKMVWETKAGDIVPASFVLKLGNAIGIGGTVVDSSDNPVADAQLRLSRFWSGGEEMNKRGEQSDFSSRTLTTDAQGRWQVKGVPPDLLNRIGISVSHPDYVSTRVTAGGNADEAKLRDGTHRIVLLQGLLVQGKVTDDGDNPIENARVWAGMANFSGTQDTKTDAQGKFTFRNLKEGETQFSVLAKGRKPEIKTLLIKPGMEEILFRLGPGQVVRGIVKNETGEAVPGVRIALESPSGGVSQDYQFEMTTDDAGRFEWDGAPDEARNFCFLKTGYEAKRRQTLKPDVENLITLRKGRKVHGWVLDAQTEKPIPKFSVGTGRSYSGVETFYPDYPGMKTIADVNGAFSLELNEEETRSIKAVADDYGEQVEKLPEAENGVVQVVLRLKPSASLRGMVIIGGVPVPGASVALTTGNRTGGGVSFRNGRLEDFGRGKVVTTDAAGEFVIASPPETGIVLAVADAGFGSATIEQVRASGRLDLQAFGRVEGTFKIAGQPVAGQEFLFSMMNVGVSFDFNGYKATTDDAGRFAINKVPAGEGQIVRLVKTSGNSWMHSHNTDIAVEPDKTTQVTLGDTGAVLKGRVTFETPPGEGESLVISGNLATVMPERPNFSTAEEARAFYDSPEWKEKMKQHKTYSVTVNADGSLMLDSIPPGNYTLSINASKTGSRPWENPPVAKGSVNVVVPENASPFSPIAIEEIVLKPTPFKPGGR